MFRSKRLILLACIAVASVVASPVGMAIQALAQEKPMSLASSDHWEFFPRGIDDKTAFIFYDEGISGRINDSGLPDLLVLRLKFKQPRPDGLSSQEEFEALSAFEDRLTPVVDALGGLYVGRVTFDGYRRFHIFLPAGADHRTSIKALADETGYPLEFSLGQDPDKSGYWQIYPDADERQIVSDLNLLRNLEDNGDNPEIERQIDHLAYLPSEQARLAFRSWVEDQGYGVSAAREVVGEELPFALEFTHVGRTAYPDVTGHSIAISRKARELGGTYDGWGTTVEKQ